METVSALQNLVFEVVSTGGFIGFSFTVMVTELLEMVLQVPFTQLAV
jgi:hypothetical protein